MASLDMDCTTVTGASSGVHFVLTPAPLGSESPLSSPSFSLASPPAKHLSLQPDHRFQPPQGHCDLRKLNLVENDEALLGKPQRKAKRLSQPSALGAFLLDMQKRSEAAKAKTRGHKHSGCRQKGRAFTRMEQGPVTRLPARSQSVTVVRSARTLAIRLGAVEEITQAKKRDLSEEGYLKRLDRDFQGSWSSFRPRAHLSRKQTTVNGAGHTVETQGRALWATLTSHHVSIPRPRALQTIKAKLPQPRKEQWQTQCLHRHTLSTPLMSLPQSSRQVGSRAVVKMQEALRNFIDVPKTLRSS